MICTILLHTGFSGVIGLLINLLVFALVILVIFWVLGLLGVPQKIVQVIAAILALILILSLFVGCAGYTNKVGVEYTNADGTSYGLDYAISRDAKTIKPVK